MAFNQKAYLKQWRSKNKARIAALNHARYLRKKDQIKDYHLAYYAKNRQAILKKNEARRKAKKEEYAEARSRGHRKYYQANRERITVRIRNYHKAHPEVARAHQGKRRAQTLKTQVNPEGIRLWMSQIRSLPFARCHWCGTKVSGRNIHFDHVIALTVGGTHTIGNLCASCSECNRSKGGKRLSNWMAKGQMFFNL